MVWKEDLGDISEIKIFETSSLAGVSCNNDIRQWNSKVRLMWTVSHAAADGLSSWYIFGRLHSKFNFSFLLLIRNVQNHSTP